MPRFFNTTGPCNPDLHYMLPPERRLPEVRRLVDQAGYFVVHAARQSGKTTVFRTLAKALTAEGRYTSLLASCEVAQAAGPDIERGIAALLAAIDQAAEIHLPEDLRPPPPDVAVPAEARLQRLLSRWAQQCSRPIVLFLDEIDSLLGDVLISVLRQLRSGFPERPRHFPQSVALIGLRDVRDYRLWVRPDEQTLGTSSPFNIKVESLTLRNFTPDEVAELYEQHTAETGQVFTADAKVLAFDLTGGQPWLVNALARQAVENLAPDPENPVTREVIEAAKEILIQRRDTHFDSLIEWLREPRVQRVIEPVLTGKIFSPEVVDDDIELVCDVGLMSRGPRGLEIANPIYREVIPRALAGFLETAAP